MRTLALFVTLVFSAPALAGPTLDAVQKRGYIRCGASQGLPGMSNPDDQGRWTGIDVDVCRAIAAAVFGDPTKVRFTPLSAKERLTALQSGEIDVLSRNTTWTLTRDAALGLNWAGVTYYDGQGFMVRKDLGITNLRQLDGASVCVHTGTTSELNLGDFFRSNNLKYTPVVFEKADEAVRAYDTGRCDALTTDQSQLYSQRVKLKEPDQHIVLPEIISKEPLGPVVRHGDDQWFDIVKWSLFAMINAEEMGVTSKNVDAVRANTKDPAVRRLLGAEGDKGKGLGLSGDWAYNIIKQVGNYGEVFERNLGPGTTLNVDRGLNRLWKDGGILYAPPIR